MNNRHKLYRLAFPLLLLTISSCQKYHDTTARFNAYFLAKEKMLEIEDNLFGTPVNDYNDVLQVLVSIDTNQTKSQKANFDYCIKKASLPIQWHKSSHWVENCYNVIGKARLYQGDFSNAVSTFKYVNSKSTDYANKHEALVLLMRTFIELKEYNNLDITKDYIKKQKKPFNEENTLNYHLTLAHYYRQQDDFRMLVQHLEIVMPLVKNKLAKARYHYLLGQIYQLEEEDSTSHAHYKKVLQYNPPYELWLHAKIKATGTGKIDDLKLVSRTEKFYRKLLKDEKNWEYHDRIYYEMARFELRKKEVPKTFEYLNESIKSSTSNKTQKAYSYLLTGQLYYDSLKNYQAAASYYDSAAVTMPKENKNYLAIKEKAAILDTFILHYNIVKQEDKLQYLAKLSPDSVAKILQQEIVIEKEIAIKKHEFEVLNSKKKKRRLPTTSSLGDGDPNASKWYFDNEQARVLGNSNFLRNWGNRPLEDDWRRSAKQSTGQLPITGTDSKTETGKKGTEKETSEKDLFAHIKDFETRKSEIPYEANQLEASHRKLEKALFELGKVYFFRLNEYGNTVSIFERLFQEYPKYEFTAEAMYILYGFCPTNPICDEFVYRERLLENYPNSFYANIIKNPNFVEDNNTINKRAELLYESSFELYKNDQFHLADSSLSIIETQYPKSGLNDKVTLLKIIILGKTGEDKTLYTKALTSFISDYKTSDLVPYAEILLGKRKASSIESDGKTKKSKGKKKEKTVGKISGGKDSSKKSTPKLKGNNTSGDVTGGSQKQKKGGF